MSRSYRKTPIIGNCGKTEKQDKKEYNKSLRLLTKNSIRKWQLERLPQYKLDGNHSNIWNWQKDGKHYFNKNKYPQLMFK